VPSLALGLPPAPFPPRISAMVLPDIYPFPHSPDLGRLVQDRLKIVNQQFPALAPNTLDDFRIVADELSSIAHICQTTIGRIAARSGTHNAVEAFKDTERALDWVGCMDLAKNVTSSTDRSSPSCGQGRASTFSTHTSLPRARPACYRSARSVYIGCSEDTIE
jgi:hypothetical protein